MLSAFLNADSIRKLFEQVRKGKLTPDDAVARLRHLPFEDLGFAKVDHHRALRNGMPEVILGEGKTPAQVAGIFARLAQHGGNILATRSNEKQFAAVRKKVRAAEYRDLARAIVLQRDPTKYGKGIVAVVSAGTSDIPVAEEAVVTAEVMGNEVQHFYDVGVAGIHRLLANREALDPRPRRHRLRRHGRRVAQRRRRPGRRSRDRRAHQRWLRRIIQGNGRAARDAQLLRVERERGKY